MSARSAHSGWDKMKFGDVVRLSKARCQDPLAEGYERYVGLEHLVPGNLRIRNWGNVADGVTFTSVFKPGQVLFGKRRAYQRKVAVADFAGVCSGDIYVLESKDADVLLPELLPFICQTDAFFAHAVGTSAGSLSPRTNWSSLAGFEFALPPMEEQRRLALLLRAELDLIEAKQVALSQVDICLKAARAQFLVCGINGNEPALSGLPDGWRVGPLSDLVEFLDSKRVPIKSADRSKRQGKYPYYGASSVIDYIDDFIFDEELILVGEDGANIVDRSTPLAFKVSGKIWVNNHAHVLRVVLPNNIDYLVDYLESISYKPYVTGTAQPKLNKAALGGIQIPVPPTDEQDMIATVYSRFHSGRDALLSELEALGGLYRQTLRMVMAAEHV